MADHPAPPVPVDHVQPVPRRIRALLAGEVLLDTTRALYVWEHPYYPQYYVPRADVRPAVLVDEHRDKPTSRGVARLHGVRAGAEHRAGAALHYPDFHDAVRFDWAAADLWFEEDEQVFVHPRSPYVRVDALRSSRTVRIELDGVVVAESSTPVLVFETGLPTRYYLSRTDVDFRVLTRTATVTACPYKGTTTDYWSIVTPTGTHQDLAWSYSFPTKEMLPIAGLVAFYNEKVDVLLDGVLQERPVTHF
ncbi:DUF427 domain-containing protein [Umezawaea tangerina]|uniref:Uncharacterized protein (DUF427 family) n=1 Tax=Umezawaea tangerina TaxID=84725 RepID=A0A2T0T3X8_9PSEU|nr:DUF427 domain-containing protein [Umezawaea tangerina]PRY40380.1 uncharacterized protein (DUF427 family) [Umezawaea tangerina]